MCVFFSSREGFFSLACFSFSLQVLFWEPGLLKITPAVLGWGSRGRHHGQNHFWLSAALLAGRSTGQGPEPPREGEGVRAGLLERCWWGWKLEHPLWEAVRQEVPEVWKLFPSLCGAVPSGRNPRHGVGFPPDELEKVGGKPKQPMKGMVKWIMACLLHGVMGRHKKPLPRKLVIWSFLRGIVLNDIVMMQIKSVHCKTFKENKKV